MGDAKPLAETFYRKATADVARALLGCRLTRFLPDGSARSVILVETEAYLGVKDRAAHTWNGRRTPRVEPMWGPAGHAYVYFVYGMHFCLNVVTQEEGVPEAVLLRAGIPEEYFSAIGRPQGGRPGKERIPRTSGVKGRRPLRGARSAPLTPDVREADFSSIGGCISSRRISENPRSSLLLLASGPAKLCAYLDVTTALSGASLSGPELVLSRGPRARFDVLAGPRIGVDYAGEAASWALRFAVAGCPAVTRPKGLQRPQVRE
jgi:DNA-3-methyladenine glycosylase